MKAASPTETHGMLRFAAIVLILLAGVLTGAQLGKIAPLIPWYVNDGGLSLVSAGWLAAILGIFIAAAALPAGWVIGTIGLARSIGIGAFAMTVGGVALALADGFAFVFSARLVEAVGYLALCIALPATLNAISPDDWKGPVLAIWSGFVPLGFALSDFLASAMLWMFNPTAFLLLMTALFTLLAVGALLMLTALPGASAAPERVEGGLQPTLIPPVLLLAASFGAFVVLSVSMFTFMPAFVAEDGTHYLVSAGAVALSVPIGNVLAGVLVRGRSEAFMAWLAIAGFAVGVVVAVPAFVLANSLAATVSVFLLAISGAVVASAQFAAIPFLTPRKGSVPVAIGLVAQAGGIGTVFGPPVAAAIIEAYGWAGFGWFLTAVGLFGLVCMLPLIAAEPSPRR